MRSEEKPVTTIGICSGKGGVGKTNVAINLSAALGARGRRVLLMDADLGLANIDVLMGLKPAATLETVLTGHHDLDEVCIDAAPGVQLIPASSGVAAMANLSTVEHAGLINAFADSALQPEYLFVDIAAGISPSVLNFGTAVQHVLVVLTDNPASIADAYGLIKSLSQLGVNRFGVITNMMSSEQRGHEVFHRLLAVTDRFLSIAVTHLGSIPADSHVDRAIRARQPVLTAYPGSASAEAFRTLASAVEASACPRLMSGRVEFFMDSLVNVRQPSSPLLQAERPANQTALH